MRHCAFLMCGFFRGGIGDREIAYCCGFHDSRWKVSGSMAAVFCLRDSPLSQAQQSDLF
jgi:hypothetical protein